MADNDITWINKLQVAGPRQSTIVIQVNPRYVSNVTKRLEPYKNFPEKFRPALEAIADYMRKEAIPRTFKNEGPGWPGLAKRTQIERALGGYGAEHPILQRSGDLYKELVEKSHPNHIEIIKTGKNARLVLGGSSTKYVRNQMGNTMFNIPSRPMIPGTGWLALRPEDDQAMRRIITQKVREVMSNG